MTDTKIPRRTRSDKGQKRAPHRDNQGKREIMLTLRPDNLDWARKMVATGEYSSISEYIDCLLAGEEFKSRCL